MTNDLKKIFDSVKLKQYAPVYVIDGEESYYLDMLTDYFETAILPPADRDFNLSVFYGRDADWAEIVSACRRFPMFADKQVVILKDASQLRGKRDDTKGRDDLKGLNSLLAYIQKPLPSTLFLIEHSGKKVDGKTRFGRFVKEKCVCYTSDKLREDKMPAWIQTQGKEMAFNIGDREATILAGYLGNDLRKIVNELEKVRINVPGERELTAQMIQKYIGISREYNVFEFPEALTSGDGDKLYKMLAYFTANPRSAPFPLMIGAFYMHFNRLYIANYLRGKPDKEVAAQIGMSPFFVKDIMAKLNHWNLPRVEHCLLLLGRYGAMAVGVNSDVDDKELLKELVGQMLE